MYAERVMWKTAWVPLIGIGLAAALPLGIYALRDRHERMAIEALRDLQRAQQVFATQAGGYASDLASLQASCDGAAPALDDEPLRALDRAGYVVELRASAGAAARGRDCHGRPLVSDYYLAGAPKSAASFARQAFAGDSRGRLHLFYDGVAPRERDVASGLATPVEARESFRIP